MGLLQEIVRRVGYLFGRRRREQSRDPWLWGMADRTVHALRHGLRTLWSRPGFAVVAIASLALVLAWLSGFFGALAVVLAGIGSSDSRAASSAAKPDRFATAGLVRA